MFSVTKKIHLCYVALAICPVFAAACKSQQAIDEEEQILKVYEYDAGKFRDILATAPAYDGFDFPICKPDGKPCYVSRSFGVRNHLGEDWNAAANNEDLGLPIFSIGNGVVTYAADIGRRWGNVLRVVHKVPGTPSQYVEALYAHLEKIDHPVGTLVKRGDALGTMGTAGGIYEAHLHLELRSKVGMAIGPGYSVIRQGYLAPRKFIRAHRPTPSPE